jgi:hypothetical protein
MLKILIKNYLCISYRLLFLLFLINKINILYLIFDFLYEIVQFIIEIIVSNQYIQ